MAESNLFPITLLYDGYFQLHYCMMIMMVRIGWIASTRCTVAGLISSGGNIYVFWNNHSSI